MITIPMGEDLFNSTIISFKDLSKSNFLNNGLFLSSGNDEWVNNTLLHMGYPDMNSVPTNMHKMVHETASSVIREVSPTFLFKSESLESCSSDGFCTRRLRIQSCKWGHISSLLMGVTHVCCFALTMGSQSEAKIKALGDQSIMRAFV